MVEQGGEQAVERFGIGDPLEPVLDDTDADTIFIAAPVPIIFIERAEIRAIREALLDRKSEVLFDAPEQVSPSVHGLFPE